MTEEYAENLIDMLALDPGWKTIPVYADPLPGEEMHETLMRDLETRGILIREEDRFYVDRDLAAEYDENLLKVLDAIQEAEMHESMSFLEDMGLVASSVNDIGEPVWFITELGQTLAENIPNEDY